ncbi:hypothetical protein EUGRSUZ_H02998 [Eucalyptus grandis]|uniref:Uncharacterized protein n=2 Tax=Eucalyptus grandis TaxID=71139 RepID=A0ACC3JT87_EUCGR|nr:hypothetical protein EUGRSUZ_H02998 [Eucalyptus grandis]
MHRSLSWAHILSFKTSRLTRKISEKEKERPLGNIPDILSPSFPSKDGRNATSAASSMQLISQQVEQMNQNDHGRQTLLLQYLLLTNNLSKRCSLIKPK